MLRRLVNARRLIRLGTAPSAVPNRSIELKGEDMQLKYSQFNIIDEIKEGTFSFYNTKNRKHLLLHPNEKISTEHFYNDSFILELSRELREKLIQHEFIVSKQIDELEGLEKMKEQDRKENYAGLFLTILPTLQCNFKCSYCFEDSESINAKIMDAQTQDNIIQFIESKLLTGIKDKIQVKWFGGEPLLAKNVMFSLSKSIKKLAKTAKLEYQSTIVTNGYLLDRLTKEEIEDLKVSSIQVTLDGLEQTHNKRRPAKNGDNSFSKIVENIEKVLKFFQNIIIRMNIDKTNAHEIHHLLKFLKQRGILHAGCQVYFAFVDTEMGKYSMESQCSAMLNRRDIQDIYEIITSHLEEENLSDLEPLYYPRFLSVACDAQIKNYYVINPEGFVFKCSGDASFPDRSLFNLNTRKTVNSERGEQFLNFSATENKRCRKCSLLPICQGGCVAKYMDLENGDSSHCWPFCHIARQRLVRLSRRKLP